MCKQFFADNDDDDDELPDLEEPKVPAAIALSSSSLVPETPAMRESTEASEMREANAEDPDEEHLPSFNLMSSSESEEDDSTEGSDLGAVVNNVHFVLSCILHAILMTL